MAALIKFYTDAHIAKVIATQLRNKGVDAICCQDVNMTTASDPEHLEYATAEGRAIVTNDQGFSGLHAEWLQVGKQHAGIFLITHDKENIGMIVNTLAFWHEAIINGAAQLETDVYNQLNRMP